MNERGDSPDAERPAGHDGFQHELERQDPSRARGCADLLAFTAVLEATAGQGDDAPERFVARAGLRPKTQHPITTLEGLQTEIGHVRRLGYALEREENEPGLGCVAAPIRDPTGTITYGISITTLPLEHTLAEIEEMSLAVKTADQIYDALGHRA